MPRDPNATRARWRLRIQRFHKAGLSIRAFCQREGVSLPSFYTWRKKLASAQPSTSAAATSTTPAFQTLHLTPLAPVLAIELPSGTRLEVPADHLQLARLVVRELARAAHANTTPEA